MLRGAQALEVARQLDSGQPPILEVAASDEQLIQVLDPAGPCSRRAPIRR